MRNASTFTLCTIIFFVVSNMAFAANDCRLEGYWLSKNPNEKITFGKVKSGDKEGEFQWRVDEYATDGKYALSPGGYHIHFNGMTRDTSSGIQKRFDAVYTIAMTPADFPVILALKGDNPSVEPQDFHRNPSDPTDTSLIASLCNH